MHYKIEKTKCIIKLQKKRELLVVVKEFCRTKRMKMLKLYKAIRLNPPINLRCENSVDMEILCHTLVARF